MFEELSREIQKLEIRFQDFIKNEEKFMTGLWTCLEKFKELNNNLEKFSSSDSNKVEELKEFRLEATRAFNDALKRESRAEHEKSHLLESYGALILAMEEAFYSLKT
jgi:hypothetical protein